MYEPTKNVWLKNFLGKQAGNSR